MCSCVLWAMLPESNKMMMMMVKRMDGRPRSRFC